jgi:hypothetical protein
MKIIDKTPFQNEKGEISLWGRIQGTLEFGFDWYAEQMAQKTVIAQLERVLEKGFVLIRNLPLPDINVAIPLILIGPPGIFVIQVTPLRGIYEAKGDQWNIVSGERIIPARINLLTRTIRMARAVQIFLQKQGLTLPVPVEPVLIAANPGLHIDSLRPIVRVVMSDAIKQFALSLTQGRAVLRPDAITLFSERLIEPRPPKPEEETPPSSDQAVSRARAIFNAAEEITPPAAEENDLSFAFQEEQPTSEAPPFLRESSPARPLPAAAKPRPRRFMGMTPAQLAFLAAMLLIEVCVVVGFAIYLFLNQASL